VDEIVASQDGAGGPWYYRHYDGTGNCIMLTTANGGLQEQYDYDAFGFPYFYGSTGVKFVTPSHTRFLFTGREWLRDLRIYDYRARQYQPELGRFLQPDPKEFGAGDYNLYRYCHNDPVNKSDPFGLRSLEEQIEANEVPTLTAAKIALGIQAPTTPAETMAGSDFKGVIEMVTSGGVGGVSPKSGAAIQSGAKIFPKLYAQLEKQATQHGLKTVEKALRTMEKTLAAHQAALAKYAAQGGYTSAVAKTIIKIEGNIATVKQFLKDKNAP
jgi:RHS repeat-associated protein